MRVEIRILNFSILHFALHHKEYFTEPQYLVADCAFKLTTTVITPFRQNSKVLTAKKRASFNRFLSSKRVRIEHSFGVMKEKFPSLKCLKIRIKDEASHKFACTWIRVCCILHNILLPHYDEEDLSPILSHDENGIDEEDECVDDEKMVKPNELHCLKQ